MVSGFFGAITLGGASVFEYQAPMIWFSLSKTIPPDAVNIVESGLIALIDTGADMCSIDSALVKKHKLILGPKIPTIAAGVQKAFHTCEVRIILEDGQPLQLMCRSVALRASSSQFDFLFGMDAIRFFCLSVTKSLGEVTLQQAR
jgi:hypothetical protein